MNTLELEILRKFKKEEYTIGRFSADGVYLCDTIEDKVRELIDLNNDGDFDDPGEGKVYGRTAIPEGRYPVLFTMSPKLGRMLPLIVGVYGFIGIRIHGGKNANWSEGCPCVGENRKPGELINYQHWEEVICNLVEDAIRQGKKVFITIK